MTTQRAPNGVTNGHNGFHSDSEPESPTTDSSDTSSDGLNGITNGAGALKLNPRKRMKRKQSSPMMPAFMVSAPGKVIMFGEHAVVHGKVSARAERRGGELGRKRGTRQGSTLTFWVSNYTGSDSGRHLAAILPPRHNPLQVEADSNTAVPRHRFRPHVEH